VENDNANAKAVQRPIVCIAFTLLSSRALES
jgi:hypothetical protein